MHRSRSHLNQLICLGLLSSLLPHLCFAINFPDYPLRSAADYAIKAQQSTLTIGVQPLDDPAEQKTYFHTKFSPKGFLPVFVVIQNAASAPESYIFDRTKTLLITETTAPATTANGTPQVSYKAATVAMFASMAALSLAGSIISMKMTADLSEIQDHLLLNELQSTTLSPGASVHGFLFIPIPKQGDRAKLHLKLPMLKSGGDNDALDFDLVF